MQIIINLQKPGFLNYGEVQEKVEDELAKMLSCYQAEGHIDWDGSITSIPIEDDEDEADNQTL